jgi:hypothetical protein
MLLAVIFNFLIFTIILSFLRVQDKVFWLEFKRLCAQIFGEIPNLSLKDEAYMQGNTATFMMSSYNIELVHIILKAVSEYTVGTPKSKTNYKVYQAYDFKNKNTFTIDCVQIQNYKNWDISNVNNDQGEL